MGVPVYVSNNFNALIFDIIALLEWLILEEKAALRTSKKKKWRNLSATKAIVFEDIKIRNLFGLIVRHVVALKLISPVIKAESVFDRESKILDLT